MDPSIVSEVAVVLNFLFFNKDLPQFGCDIVRKEKKACEF